LHAEQLLQEGFVYTENMSTKNTPPSAALVILAFAILYIVWGSTYFFIQLAIHDIPPFIMGFIRFTIAGLLLAGWCMYNREKLWNPKYVVTALITGFLLLFIGNGAVIYAEKIIPSSLAAVLVSSSPLWFVVLDKPQWKTNFKSRETIIGLVIGFIGVLLLFGEQFSNMKFDDSSGPILFALIILVIGTVSWAAGSLYSKYNGGGSAMVNSSWQMLAAAFAFLISSFAGNEWQHFEWQAVPAKAWMAVLYLIFFGSIAGYSAYVWLLSVRPVTQVSTYAYVNPVVAVLLGVFFANEKITWMQVLGLTIILTSVLLINLAKYKKQKKTSELPVENK
jgi:drug/metabolite transporter (DMT)-like permease